MKEFIADEDGKVINSRIIEAFDRLSHLPNVSLEQLMAGHVVRIGPQDPREVLRIQIREAAAQLERLERFPESDPYGEGDIVIYARVNRRGVEPITVAFLRIKDNYWYSTGSIAFPQAASWKKLVESLVEYDIIEWTVLKPQTIDVEAAIDVVIDDATNEEAKPWGPGTNTGHGHVWPRPDGMRARCGGARMCQKCRDDAARLPNAGTTES